MKNWDPALHPRVPRGSGDMSGEFTAGEGAVSAEPKVLASQMPWLTRPPRMRVIGSGTMHTEQQYKDMQAMVLDEMTKVGLAGYPVHFEFGPPARIESLEGYMVASRAAYFHPGYRGKDGYISFNLDAFTPDGYGLRGTARHESLHARFEFARNRSVFTDRFIDSNMASLAKEDGTTKYSRAWWTKATGTGNQIDQYRAVNESLAEMHKDAMRDWNSGGMPPTYKQLDDRISNIWLRHGKVGRGHWT